MVQLTTQGGDLIDHFHAARGAKTAVLAWDVRGPGLLPVRILRSQAGFATDAEEWAVPATEQMKIYEGWDTSIMDHDLVSGVHDFYTVFAKGPDGVWREQVRAKVTPEAEFHWTRDPSAGPSASLKAFNSLRRLAVEQREQ